MRRAVSGSVGLIAIVVGAITPTPVVTLAAGRPATTSGVPAIARCAVLDVRHAAYGVYVAKGQVTCTTAKKVLRGVDGGRGRYVDKGGSYNSYTLYDGWLCPSGQMGIQTCEAGTKPVAHPRRQIFSLACAGGAGQPGCPKLHVGAAP